MIRTIRLIPPISIHALHEESDHDPFQRRRYLAISIHALHEESDPSADNRHAQCCDFNPRSP